MRIRTLLQAVIFVAFFFFAVPEAFAAISEALGWPRWRSAAGEGLGTICIVVGAGIGLYCSDVFIRRAGGTPVPVAPPTRLVETGLFRYSRNPMYVGYVLVAVGIALVEGHAGLILYPIALFVLGQVYLVYWEEPALRKRFGAGFDDYCARVPRWIGRTRPSAGR